jgi:hypothetical protein
MKQIMKEHVGDMNCGREEPLHERSCGGAA